ncbi:MAG: biotin attachment protein [Bacteroidaceae bacterium]|nr:biotin attachment protein [Bacteroidaceae bacterium]
MKDFKFNIGNQSYEAQVTETQPGTLEVVVNGKTYNVEVEGKKAAVRPSVSAPKAAAAPAPAAAAPKAVATSSSVVSPLPGTITKIAVTEGQQVKRGETLVVMEAMKMANDISAECDGVVGKIHVTVGQSVNQNDVLVDFQGAAAPAAPAPKPAAAPAPKPAAAPAPAPAPAAAPAASGAVSTVTSPLPGVINQVLVKPGDAVQSGQAVVIVEAMKMQNEVVADVAGTVKNVLVAQGAQVQGGDVLVEIA